MSDIKFRATVDSKKGEVSLQNLDKSVGSLEKKTKTAGGGFKSLAIGVAAGAAAFAIASKALRGLIQWTKDAIEKSAEQEAVEKRLETVLKSTGEAAGLNKKELLDMASALQQVTIYGDETIIGAQNLLLTFTKIGKEVFPEALETVMDMSTALGTDLKGSALSLGKALNDPILGVTALQRVGVSFTEQQKEQIKTLVRSGDILKAQKLILTELRTEFGGMSKAAVDTYQGAVKQLSDVYGDLKEKIGDAITENETIRESIVNIKKAIEDFLETGKIESWAADVSLYVDTAIQTHKGFWGALKKANEAFEQFIGAAPKGKEGVDDYAEAVRKLNEALERAGIEQITTGDSTHYTAKAMLTAAERADIFARAAEALSFKMEDVWYALRVPSEVMEDWDKLFAMVETPELDLAFDQFALSAEDNFANVMESLGFFVRESEDLAEDWNAALVRMSDDQKAFSAVAIGEFMNMEASLKGFVGAILGTLENWAIGELIPRIMAALPFPANILAVGGAVLFIKSFFPALKPKEGVEGKAEGGWVGLHGEEIVRVGEKGPEYITSNRDTRNFYDQRARKIDVTIIVQDQLDPYTAQRITRQQIVPQILESLDINENKNKWKDRLGIE